MMLLRLPMPKSILTLGIMLSFCTSPALASCDVTKFLGQLNSTVSDVENGLQIISSLSGIPGGGGGTSDQGTHDRLDAVLQSTNGQIKQLGQTFCPLSSISVTAYEQRLNDIANAIKNAQQKSIIDDSFASNQMKMINAEAQALNALAGMVDSPDISSIAVAQVQAKLQAELISQLYQLRAFELARLRQDQIDHQAAIDDYAMPAKPPSEYTGQ